MFYFKRSFGILKYFSKQGKTLDISAVKATATNAFTKNVKYELESNENKIIRNIIENPDRQIQVNERDIHKAIKVAGSLPEDEFKSMIESGEYRIDKYLSSLSTYLNISLVEICRTAKNSPVLRKDKRFWQEMEKELELRKNSLSNEQITDVITFFAKAEVRDLKFFKDFEEVVIESEITFIVIFYNSSLII